MPEYPGLPGNIYQWDNLFSYSSWTPGTRVMLCSVPWDASYRDIVSWNGASHKEAYFNGLAEEAETIVVNSMTYLPYGQPVRVSAPFATCCDFNYLVVYNPSMPVPQGNDPLVFYYFVTDVRYVAPNTTELQLQLDVWTTYGDRCAFNSCYVVRGHAGIANSKSDRYNTVDYLTEPEGLNIGDEYETFSQIWFPLVKKTMYVLFSSTANLEKSASTDGIAQLATATGEIVNGVPSGANCYACEYDVFPQFMRAISEYPWVSQCINFISVVPDTVCMVANTVSVFGVELLKLSATDNAWYNGDYSIKSWRAVFETYYGTRYANLHKFLVSPYSMMEVTGYNGGEIVLKPECVQSEDVTLTDTIGEEQVSHTFAKDDMQFSIMYTFALPNMRTVVYPAFYNGVKGITQADGFGESPERHTNLVGGENLDMGLVFGSWPQLALVNNMYQYYLASTQYSRQYSFDSAEWAQSKALQGADVSYRQAQGSIGTNLANMEASNAAAWGQTDIANQQVAWNTVKSAASSVMGGVSTGMGGSPVAGTLQAVGGAALAIGEGIQQAGWNTQSTGISTNLARTQAENTAQNSGFIADTNLAYAQYAARGDYQLAIQGIQAKVQDARLTQPSTSGQQGGDTFNLSNNLVGFMVKFKAVKRNYVVQVGEYWLRYGYYVNRWIAPPRSLMCMEKFTYWKMQSVYLEASQVPELFKETVRGIFEVGVTVWREPGMIGTTDNADNPISSREGEELSY